MSRLYATVNSDARQKELTTRGHKTINVNLFYGSKDDSRQAIGLTLVLPDDKEKPLVMFTLGDGIEAKELKGGLREIIDGVENLHKG